METSTLKGLELLLIVGLVGWFYLSQRRNLARLKAEREAKENETDKPDGQTDGS